MDIDLNALIDVRKLISYMANAIEFPCSDDDMQEQIIDACREYFETKFEDGTFGVVDMRYFARLMAYQGLGLIDRVGDSPWPFKDLDAEEYFRSTLSEEPPIQLLIADLFADGELDMDLVGYVIDQIVSSNTNLKGKEDSMKMHIKLLALGWAWLGNKKSIWVWDDTDKTRKLNEDWIEED